MKYVRRDAFRLVVVVLLLRISFPLDAAWKQTGEGAPGEVMVTVRDNGTRQPLPCRLTVVDKDGNLTALQIEKKPWLAVRQGVVYTATGEARFRLPEGRYTIYATRGF